MILYHVVLLFIHFDALYCLAVDIAVASLTQYRDNLRVAVVADDVVLTAVTVHETEAHAVAVHLDYSVLLILLRSRQYSLYCLKFHNFPSFFKGSIIFVSYHTAACAIVSFNASMNCM